MKTAMRAAAFALLASLTILAPASAKAQQWTLMDGAARDVGVGADGSVWVIGTAAVPGGYEIYRRNADNKGWTRIAGGAERIAVDPAGNAWVVNNSQTIFRWDGTKWLVVPGQARDVGVGPNGTVWVIGNNGEAGGYGIYRSTNNGANWTKIPGSALRVAVDAQNNGWVVNNSNNIFRYDGSKWVMTPGAAKDIGAGADGAVWVIGTDGGIYRWDGSNWVRKTGGARDISVGPNGIVWVVNNGNQIYRTQEAAPATATLSGQTMVLTGQSIQVNPVAPAPTGTTSTLTGGTLVSGGGFVPGVTDQKLVVGGLPGVFSPGQVPTGYLICPIIAEGMKLVKGCTDVIGQSLRGKTSGPATYLGKAKSDSCPSGFRDDGDYCAKPAAYGRGGGYAWQFGDRAFDPHGQWARCQADNPQGCEQPGGGITLVYPKCRAGFHAFGTNICSPDCPSGWEDIGVSCKKPNTMGSCSAYGRVAGLGPALHDPRNGGECWACPSLLRRTMHPVTNTDPNFPACSAGLDDGIVWQSPQYPEPGVAGFVGNGDIVRLAFADRAYVDAFLSKRAAGNAARKQELWNQMINAPNDSAEFKALVFAALMTAAKQDPELRTGAGSSVGVFQSYIQQRRTFVAQEAVRMYYAYEDFNAYKQWKGAGKTMLAGGGLAFASMAGSVITTPSASLAGTVGAPPDDYVNAAYSAALPDAKGQSFLSALSDLGSMTYTAPSIGTASGDPVAALQLGLNVANSAKSLHDLLGALKVVSEIAALSGKVGIGLDLGMGLGGSVLDAVAGIMTFYAQQEAKAQYGKLVEEAQKPVNIRNIILSGSDDDKNSLMMWWALATSPYKADGIFRQGVMTNAEACARYQSQCDVIRSVVTAARL